MKQYWTKIASSFRPNNMASDFGLVADIEDNMSHKAILNLMQYQQFSDLVGKHGFVFFEGNGIDDGYDSLISKSVNIQNLNRSLNWHIDKKETLILYYPVGSWRPCDFIVSNKDSVINSLKQVMAENLGINKQILTRILHTLATTDPNSQLDINIAIAELSCLNSHLDYEQIVTTILTKQLQYMGQKAARLSLTKDKCQIIFCKDSAEGNICHGRIRNNPLDHFLKAHEVKYYSLKNGAVSVYPDKI